MEEEDFNIWACVKVIIEWWVHKYYGMNAGLGGFAASLSKYPVWVMNVVPHDAMNRNLGIIYERGLVGTYMNWFVFFVHF